MAGLFARHVINGFDQRYETPYIEQVDTGSQRWMRVLGFLLVFLALARVAWPAARRSLGPSRWRYPVGLLLCGAASLPSAVETRFLLPAYVLAYLLALAPGWPNPLAPRATARQRSVTVAGLAVAFALYMAVVLHVVGSTTEQLRFV
ncbi:MAG TPA: hypothetical protein VHF88_00640 [Thermoleophilaceae bacterium]|nr:hypothetical protein [Thermoleophilaceae bacterium]